MVENPTNGVEHLDVAQLAVESTSMIYAEPFEVEERMSVLGSVVVFVVAGIKFWESPWTASQTILARSFLFRC